MKKSFYILICGILLAATTTAHAQTWNCGAGVTATLSEGTLTVSGAGAMDDYTGANEQPWLAERASITAVVVQNGVIAVGAYAFAECPALATVTIQQ